MFDSLRRGQQPGIDRRRTLVFIHDLGAFVGDADDRVTGLACGFLSIMANTCFETIDVALGFGVVLLESGLEHIAVSSLRQLRKRLQNFLLGEIDTLRVS
jgi:hypothetical protein